VDGANTIRLRVTDDSSPTPKTSVTTATVNLVGPPANDNFANAIDLTGAGADQTGDVTTGTQSGTYSASSSMEVGEPAILGATRTVWFKWTSPGDGAFTIQTNGSTNGSGGEWDSMIGIYTGASVNALTPVPGPGNNPQDTGVPETKTVTVTPGTTYYFQLAGYQDQDAANILLSWNYVATVYQAEILTYGPGAAISPVVDNAATITWTVPFDSDLSTLAPTFTLFVGATATLDGNPAVSGATVDFSGGPKDYIVTSKGGAFVTTYTVTAVLAPPPTDGTWITDGNGNWNDPANWQDGTIADGRGKTAFFTTNITAARTVTLDTARTIGNIVFTDSTTASHDLTISGANILTLDVTTGTPEINVTQTGNRQLTISSVISGSDGLKKVGPGILNLTGANTYTGTTTVSEGHLNFASANINGIGGGAGSRDISVSAGKIVQRAPSVLNADFMKRLVETTDEIVVCTNGGGASDVGTGNTVDFSSSSNGANLPNAFLGSFATNGAQCRYNGTIIPASDAYRLGYPGTNGALSMIQPLVDIGASPRGLIVGGATPVLVADNTFTGDTVLKAGRLFLGRQLALQNSALNVGNGAGDGILGQICFLASNSGGATQGQLTDQPTLGGLIGARNLASIYNSNNQNNTTRLAVTAVLGLTLDVDSGKTHTYSGNARLATGMYLTKTGPGTQVLSGANDYTGATSVNEGTLALVGGSHKSPITVATGASLGFTLGSPSTSTAALNLTNGTVKITGAVDNVSDYKLMTASTISGTPALDSPITDYQLQKLAGDTELWLVHTGAATPYTTWASTNAPTGNPDDDYDGDGVSNAVEFVLGGLATTNDLGKLPTLATNGTNMTFTFTRAQSSIAASTLVTIEVGTNLSTWPTSYAVPDTAIAGPPVAVVDNLDGTDTVTLTVAQAPDAAKFARLKVVITP
jgi:autotransporter-associated beta strand protein